MNTKHVAPKEIIFREGEMGDAAYIIRSGSVEILKHAAHGDIQLAVLEAGTLFGEMALVDPKDVRSASARALDEVELDVISDEELHSLMGQCPERLLVLIQNVFKRLKDVNQRLAAKERATVVLDSKIDSLTIAPASDDLMGIFEPVTLQATHLPYSVGGYPVGEDNPRRNDLDIPSEGPPLIISQQHIKIENKEDGVFVTDQGSRFCSIVNGKVIGRGKVDTRAPLQLGENTVTLGDYKSPYKLLITCE